eukprot:CAMPEP_0117554740 /NCGR_PEP_ID=MMETSP0784-20121206/50911_1 /TAXON_ID=39447 /ORGANISM="" /LENGTH=205 /DNA_ID=CAMNT_0005351917 /DNA_START=73 /DNA_END=691 /DNA_ORIENTATION=-
MPSFSASGFKNSSIAASIMGRQEVTYSTAEKGHHAGDASRQIPVEQLPPLPLRDTAYRIEPLLGIGLVVFLSAVLVGATCSTTASVVGHSGALQANIVFTMILAEAACALFCLLYVLFGNAGVIKRSASTCYPMPAVVETRLREGRCLSGMQNILGTESSMPSASYCVRCLVWRPHSSKSGAIIAARASVVSSASTTIAASSGVA